MNVMMAGRGGGKSVGDKHVESCIVLEIQPIREVCNDTFERQDSKCEEE